MHPCPHCESEVKLLHGYNPSWYVECPSTKARALELFRLQWAIAVLERMIG
jgi:hypothetical protein